jgi:hypothetical protein
VQPDVDQSVLPEVCLSMEVAILDETRAGKKPKRSPAHEGTLLEVAILDETRAQGGKAARWALIFCISVTLDSLPSPPRRHR